MTTIRTRATRTRLTADQPGRAKSLGVPLSIVREADAAGLAASHLHDKHGGTVTAYASGMAIQRVYDDHHARVYAKKHKLPVLAVQHAFYARTAARSFAYARGLSGSKYAAETAFARRIRWIKRVLVKVQSPQVHHAGWEVAILALEHGVPEHIILAVALPAWTRVIASEGSERDATKAYREVIALWKLENPWSSYLDATFFGVSRSDFNDAECEANRLYRSESLPALADMAASDAFVTILAKRGSLLLRETMRGRDKTVAKGRSNGKTLGV